MKMKHRHIKSFVEKYGINSLSTEAKDFVKKNRGSMPLKGVFDKCPYLGILYCPLDLYFWDDYEGASKLKESKESNFIKLKILEVTVGSVHFLQYDSSIDDLTTHRRYFEGFVIEGNVLKSRR